MMGDFEGKVALVTGASRLIGSSVSRALAQRGATVVINYLSGRDRAEEVASSIEAAGGQAATMQADVRNRSEVRAMVEKIVGDYGRVDILVNNARQIHPRKSFLETDWNEDVMPQIAVHLGGAFHCCQEVIPRMMTQGGGAIVNMLSTAGRAASAQLHAYGPPKAALRIFTMNLATEFGPAGIRVNSVTPGNTNTPEQPSRHRSAAEVDQLRQRAPLRRIAHPDDIAEAVVFLCSDAARHITGANIAVNGGAHMSL
jgi:3-oxoacyl-[acyl-carrier protein] reductase